MTGNDEAHLLSGAYALGALSAEESAAFEDALAGSEELRSEVAALTDTAVLLGLAVEPVNPPLALRTSLLAMLESTPQLPPLTQDSASAAPSRADPVEAPEPAVGPAEAKARAGWFSRTSLALTAAAAAVVLFAGGAILNQALNNDDQSTQAQDQAQILGELTAAPDTAHAVTEFPEGGTAELLASASLERSAVVLKGVDPLAADQVIQLWFVRGDEAVSAGLVEPDGDTVYRVMDGEFHSDDVIAMTIEPAGGSKAPTTEPMVFPAARV